MIANIKITESKILSDNWYILRKITYEYGCTPGESSKYVTSPTHFNREEESAFYNVHESHK